MALSPEMDAAARQFAEQQMNVIFQERVLQLEKDIYYDHLLETRNFIQEKITIALGKEQSEGRLVDKTHLDGWIVCGSGLKALPESSEIRILDRIQVEKIPHWFSPQAPKHGKEVIVADIKGQLVGIQTGRAHIYDTNNSPEQLKMIEAPLITAKGLGVNWVITTNAAGALDNGRVEKGDIVVDIDYVNQHGVNPFMGPNDDRLGKRFPSKSMVADPYIYERLAELIPEENLHLGIYTLASNAPFYEGSGDIVKGTYDKLRQQNPDYIQLFGMSFAMDAMTLQHFNPKPHDVNGFDRPVRWIGLTAATNVVPEVEAPTKEQLMAKAIKNPNPTSEEDVFEGAEEAEKILIPAIIATCESFTGNPLPAWFPQ